MVFVEIAFKRFTKRSMPWEIQMVKKSYFPHSTYCQLFQKILTKKIRPHHGKSNSQKKVVFPIVCSLNFFKIFSKKSIILSPLNPCQKMFPPPPSFAFKILSKNHHFKKSKISMTNLLICFST